jgi:diguanylate cyclase (GGDEF)-like protein
VRVGLRHFVTGVAFCIVAGVLARRFQDRGLGLRTTALAFGAYGVAQLLVFGIFVWQAATQSPVPWAPYLGIADLLCLAFVGMGLVVWVLDEERTRADTATEQLDRLQRYDPLTGLSNLRQLKVRLAEVCTRAKLIERDAALLLLEIDRFELIAGSLGAAGSESALIAVAERLERLVPETLGPRPARIEGHRFAVLLPLLDDPGAPAALAGRILAAFNDAIEIGSSPGRKVLLTASIGIALVPEHAVDADSLLKAAELAAQRARSDGGNTYTIYAPELRKKAQLRLSLEMELRKAFSYGQFALVYQPIVRPGDHRLAGFEALVRWRHPERGLQPPAAFLGAIEEMGLIADLDMWVLSTACQQAAIWEREYGAGVWVSVNATAHSFRLADFQQRVVNAVDAAGLPPRLLDLELTEQTALADVDQAIGCLRALREAGVSASLDDFGTGYSSLSQLRRLPVGRIKIDRSFIADPSNLKRDGAIVRALVSLAHGLDLEVLVEGVETEEQLRFCERAHCDLLQGYYFAPPLPAESCARMLGGVPDQAERIQGGSAA